MWASPKRVGLSGMSGMSNDDEVSQQLTLLWYLMLEYAYISAAVTPTL
jgi:hypothetical protein